MMRSAFGIVSASLFLLLRSSPAHADRYSFRIYDSEQGLADVGVSCLEQDSRGQLLLCTQNGVFTYDGRRFAELGSGQGLRDGGNVYNLALSSDGHVAIAYPDAIYVSRGEIDEQHPVSSLRFDLVRHPQSSFFNDIHPHQLASWRNGFVFLANGAISTIRSEGGPRASLERLPYDRAEDETLSGAKALFSAGDHLWAVFDDDRLCRADPGQVQCYSEASGLSSGPWHDVMARANGQLLARSSTSVASFDPRSNRWSVTTLPDQGGPYLAYPMELGLFPTPDGGLVTQAAHGLDVLGPRGWRSITTGDGIPAGPILAAKTDTAGQLWLQVFGRGLARWLGYGRWETVQRSEGLSADLAWQTVRSPDGSIWVATDNGLDRLVRRDGVLKVAQVVPGPSFALTMSTDGDVWSSHGEDGAIVVDPGTGTVTKIAVPPVDVVTPDPTGGVWIGTEAGLSHGDLSGGSPHVTKLPGPRTSILDIKPDGGGGIYYLAGNQLRHRHADGNDARVAATWPGNGFEPYEIAFDCHGLLWLGGPGGLIQARLSSDKVLSLHAIPLSDTLTNNVTALTLDHRGWLWVGSTQGVSVFDGQRWTTIDAGSGLVSDDVDQDGIREDPDGSVWIATTKGVSHLLDPTHLFDSAPLKVIVSEARLGSRSITGAAIPYTRAALDVHVGTADYAAERSIEFKYRLSDVDDGWTTSDSGLLRYPFMPPGRHDLVIVGIDPLTHQVSRPTTLAIKMVWPWWRQCWFEALGLSGFALLMVSLTNAATRLRLRAVYAQQAELRRLVDEKTAQLRFAAEHDHLTGLLTRSAIELRLAQRLGEARGGSATLVALLDVDHFKQINDTFGHPAGDEVLRTLGQLVSGHLGPEDHAGRYGGEEIMLILADEDERATDCVLSLFHSIRNATFRSQQHVLRVTSSVGVAWARAGDDWESLIGRTDAALYRAKREGRDRIVEGSRDRATLDR